MLQSVPLISEVKHSCRHGVVHTVVNWTCTSMMRKRRLAAHKSSSELVDRRLDLHSISTQYDHGCRYWGSGVLTPWNYVGGVRVCFDPLKCHILSLHCAISLAVQCIVIGPVCGCLQRAVRWGVFVSVITITRNCVNRSSPTLVTKTGTGPRDDACVHVGQTQTAA